MLPERPSCLSTYISRKLKHSDIDTIKKHTIQRFPTVCKTTSMGLYSTQFVVSAPHFHSKYLYQLQSLEGARPSLCLRKPRKALRKISLYEKIRKNAAATW